MSGSVFITDSLLSHQYPHRAKAQAQNDASRVKCDDSSINKACFRSQWEDQIGWQWESLQQCNELSLKGRISSLFPISASRFNNEFRITSVAHLCSYLSSLMRARSGSSQPTVHSQWASRKVMTWPVVAAAPLSLALIRPERCSILRMRTGTSRVRT